MTDKELRDAAVVELKKTTQGYLKSNGQPRTLVGAQWKKGLDLLAQIGVVPPPPPPPPGNLPAVITTGGTYSGHWVSTGATTALDIQTSQPVIIENSIIENLNTGFLLRCETAGAQVTVRNSRFNGGVWQAIRAQAFKSFVVQNCTFDKTWGCDFRLGQANSSVLFEKNRLTNTQYYTNLAHAFQANTMPSTATIEVRWNEIFNTYQQSLSEDIISIYGSWNARVHDNYCQGAYPMTLAGASPGLGGYAGGGIVIGDHGGGESEIYNNHIVDCTNYGAAIAGGHNQKMYNNRVFSDSRNDSGEPFTNLASGGIGIYVWAWEGAFPITGYATATGNLVGCLAASGSRNDWWFPAATNNAGSENTQYVGTVNHALEASEWAVWQAKLSANAITVGAS